MSAGGVRDHPIAALLNRAQIELFVGDGPGIASRPNAMTIASGLL